MPRLLLAFFLLPTIAFAQEKPSDKKDAADTKASGKKLDTAMLAGALKWRSIGPAFMSGRIGDVAIDPVEPNTWYIAVASGGLRVESGPGWRTGSMRTASGTDGSSVRKPKPRAISQRRSASGNV